MGVREAYIENYFTVQVAHTMLDVDTRIMADEIFTHQKTHKGMIKSNEGGFQSDNIKHADSDVFKYFWSQLQEEVNRYVQHVGCPQPKDIFAWYNINAYKDYNMPHKHPGSIVSGVFYVRTPENCGEINFIHPAEDDIENHWNSNKRSDALANDPSLIGTRYRMFPKENMLILFPSWLGHYVRPNMNETEKRISISFNYY